MKLNLSSPVLVLVAVSPSLVRGLPQFLIKNIFLEPRDNPLEPRGALDGLSLSTDQICGTKQPTPALREIHSALQEDPGVLPRLIGRSDPRPFEKRSLEERQSGRPTVIQTYIHWVTTYDQASKYTQTVRANVIQDQLAAMNLAYRSANISFHYQQQGSTYTIRDDWATDANSTQMKQHLRRGTYQSLNLYFQSNLSSNPGSSQPSTLLGYCTLPTTITYGNPPTEYPTADYATDGCNILLGSMPTVPNPVYGYNQGKTAVHEIGHWFGLLHTFQDNTCNPNDSGDYVNDTPQEATATSGCPSGKDSCPNSPGLDPINNYMDYSTDECYTQFTANQISRMNSMFQLYRAGY